LDVHGDQVRLEQCKSCGWIRKKGAPHTCRAVPIAAHRPDPLGLSALDQTMRDLAKPDGPAKVLPFRRTS
jgi:hypothetical protein